MDWGLRAALTDDIEPIADLRAAVLRRDLERLGRYDEHRVRQRLRDNFSARHTWVITVAGEFGGCVTLRPAADDGTHWLENFYLAPFHQGRGLGSAVLRELLRKTAATVRLQVLQGSPARRLYERHGFVTESEDPIDVWMMRPSHPIHADRVMPGHIGEAELLVKEARGPVRDQ
ncbi:GNAT family N-acetyltransferase [Streptomyces boninensis]|uniref:GNAT family N-acetyltransferase n=1 Tax=Streptomyces boninensis TaxID=2039455 RepID=UPI003B20C366